MSRSYYFHASSISYRLQAHSPTGKPVVLCLRPHREKEREEGIKSELSIESASGIKVKFKSGCKIEEIKAIVGILRC